MFRDLLSNRLIQVGLVFFVLVVGGSLLYSWHVLRVTESDLGPTPQPVVSPLKNKPATNTAPVGFQTEGVVNTPEENTDTPRPEALPNEAETLDVADAFLPEDFVSEEEAPAEGVPVSPFGFGPYPELPDGWPVDIWPRKSADHELMLRVQIKLISQGVNAFGAIMEDGLVYPTIDNTVYIRWDDVAGDRYISEIAGDPDASDRLESIIETRGDDFTEADIPSDIKIVSYEDGGINPHAFLNLP